MKFYDCQPAPSPRRVRMFIAEKRLDIESVEINLGEREQLEPEFLAINPYATVPVLELDDGARLLSTAGCRAYLEATHPEPALMGRNATERGLVADAIYRIEADALMAVAECLRSSAKRMQGRALTGPRNFEQIPALAERGRERAAYFMPVLNDMIGSKDFLLGDNLTASDIDAFAFVEFAKWIKVTIPDDCTNVQRWRDHMAERPSAGL